MTKRENAFGYFVTAIGAVTVIVDAFGAGLQDPYRVPVYAILGTLLTLMAVNLLTRSKSKSVEDQLVEQAEQIAAIADLSREVVEEQLKMNASTLAAVQRLDKKKADR